MNEGKIPEAQDGEISALVALMQQQPLNNAERLIPANGADAKNDKPS